MGSAKHTAYPEWGPAFLSWSSHRLYPSTLEPANPLLSIFDSQHLQLITLLCGSLVSHSAGRKLGGPVCQETGLKILFVQICFSMHGIDGAKDTACSLCLQRGVKPNRNTATCSHPRWGLATHLPMVLAAYEIEIQGYLDTGPAGAHWLIRSHSCQRSPGYDKEPRSCIPPQGHVS